MNNINTVSQDIFKTVLAGWAPNSDEQKVLTRFKNIITDDLTTGREDHDLHPYTTSQIEAYIQQHNEKLYIAVKEYLQYQHEEDHDIDTHYTYRSTLYPY